MHNNDIVADIGEMNFTSFPSLRYLHMTSNELYGTVRWTNVPSDMYYFMIGGNTGITSIDNSTDEIYHAKEVLTNLAYLHITGIPFDFNFLDLFNRIPFNEDEFRYLALNSATFNGPDVMVCIDAFRFFFMLSFCCADYSDLPCDSRLGHVCYPLCLFSFFFVISCCACVVFVLILLFLWFVTVSFIIYLLITFQYNQKWEYIERRFENCTGQTNLEMHLYGMDWYGEINLAYFPVGTRILNLGLNQFYGDLTNINISHITSMAYLYIYNNYDLTGTVDWSQFAPLVNLYYCQIYGNSGLTGTIDLSYFADSMYYLYLHNNDFYGNIENFGQMEDLYYFYVSGNVLNGTINWQEFQYLPDLSRFYFYDNNFVGDIDLSYMDFQGSNLQYLYGYDNEFDGALTLGPITDSTYIVYLYDNPFITGKYCFCWRFFI